MVSDANVGVISASGNDGFHQSTDTFFPEIEKLRRSTTTGKKIYGSSVERMYQKAFLPRVEGVKKPLWDPPAYFRHPHHRCVNGSFTSHVLLVSAISWSIQSWTRSFISW